MSKEKPIYGLDISGHQQGLNIASLPRQNYKFCIVKATEGPYRDGSTFTNPLYHQQIKAVEQAGMVPGVYHFLVENNPGNPAAGAKAQVNHFLKTVGTVRNRIVAIDFEAYNPPYGYLSPSNATLRHFIAELRKRGISKPIVVYSGQGYWNSGVPSGALRTYGESLVAWDAYYPLGFPTGQYGSTLYQRSLRYGWGKRWGGVEPLMWQFTSTGRIDGFSRGVDVNAFQGTPEQLNRLARGGNPPAPDPIEPGKDDGWLGPPKAKILPVVPGGTWLQQHPTRYTWRPYVRNYVDRLFTFYKGISINTYVDHPTGYRRDTTSLDVWDAKGRGYPLNPELGDAIFHYLLHDPTPPLVDWIIWKRRIYTRANGLRGVPFGNDPFSWHDDHIHVTFL